MLYYIENKQKQFFFLLCDGKSWKKLGIYYKLTCFIWSNLLIFYKSCVAALWLPCCRSVAATTSILRVLRPLQLHDKFYTRPL